MENDHASTASKFPRKLFAIVLAVVAVASSMISIWLSARVSKSRPSNISGHEIAILQQSQVPNNPHLVELLAAAASSPKQTPLQGRRNPPKVPEFYNMADETIVNGLAQGFDQLDLMLTGNQTIDNRQRLIEKRRSFRKLCSANSTTEELTEFLYSFIEPGQPDQDAAKRKLRLKSIADNFTHPCPYTFLDLGANVGDSLTKMINVDLPKCPQKEIKTSRIEYRDQTKDIRVVPFNKRLKIFNMLMKWIGEIELVRFQSLSHVGRRILPEEFCYFGIEGNPVFTDRLEQIEQKIMRSSPRPLRFAHFFTETVGTAVDGPATLYLDTTNVKSNFWGSSLDQNHPDVRASAQKDGKLTSAPVQGFSLPSLIQRTSIKQKGSLVLIKMDIEGAEKALLAAASDSPIMKEYAEAGVEIAMIVEMHGSEAEYQGVVNKFKEIGIRVSAVKDAG
mmetsp:Transcript_1356/g.1829  ORF Transcript_1356/g.1829 Transcript_1356/m.1829 type:complete len:448 (-) Transcript_1356:283-1626(-)|eukprot:CAMPEP_0198152578 /NCGR_PEP_ID=MMETSP1443-20131203/60424_1 /TAXON_ID=186043 /ORGANISM="Entomoneis sp., Strain CCMP2396" /LENGTH=447 /DNA_ID=CAMNT_0043818645 /DNA_START=39 /DNA_END=1382 /DNA_ORIENTATION=+